MYARRRHVYFVMMSTCIGLFVLAWGVVRLWSIPVAVGMCVVAMLIPPVAAIMANRRGPDDRWWDERPFEPPAGPAAGDPPADPESGDRLNAPEYEYEYGYEYGLGRGKRET